MKKLVSAGFAASALIGALFMATPAYGDAANNNLQVLPVQVCNANVGVLGLALPIASPQTTGHCTNGPISKNAEVHHYKKHHGHHHYGYHH
ncbi:hypothetical protein GCM10009799_19940 [Nocardiopsis rhodophaea]|uniref:Chaplin domain-containing protein n=1 Tax=Nocardiopsis rhodophaea TaxID=280238 RepID=A0ABN2SWT6_9ACTN